MLWIVIFGVLSGISLVAFIIAEIFWHKDFSDWVSPLSITIFIIAILMCVSFVIVRVCEKQNCLAFEETKVMLAETSNGATALENAGLTNSMVEYNSWLTSAKVKVRRYGAWSVYYGLGVEDMAYISLSGS